MQKPIALTTGDPAGIGIELAVATWTKLRHELPFFLIADRRQAINHITSVPIYEITDPVQAPNAMPHGLPLFHQDFADVVKPGDPSPSNAAAVISAIELAIDFVKEGTALAICTNPVSKRILRQAAGFPFPGQTEFLAHLCGIEQAVMMLTSPSLRVVPVSTHVRLKDVAEQLDAEIIVRTVQLTYAALCNDFAVSLPRLSIAGLNPHAGEDGEFGDEEERFVKPAVRKLLQMGIEVFGPLPADTMFHEEARKTYDAAVCMYHDQALIPVKAIDFFTAVNVTLGLPIVRTSPDHGTGFDIAGKGIARPDSLISAVRTANEIATCRLNVS